MHDDRERTEARLRRFVRDRLTPAIHRDAHPLSISAWSAPGEPVPFIEAIGQPYTPVSVGWRWGRAWSTTWLRVTGEVPAAWRDGTPPGTRAEILVDFGYNRSRSGFQAEGLAYRPDGRIIKAIAPLNSFVPWNPAADGAAVDLFIEAAANPDVAGEYTFEPTPFGAWETAPDEPLYELRQMEIALLDVPVWELAQDVWTLQGLMAELSPDSSRRHAILRAFEDMLDAIDPADLSGSAAAAREILRPALASPASATAHRIVAIGNAHIDSAWLWPLRETVRKVARTFSNVVSLIDAYPDFVFAGSSAQQFQWLKDHYPDVFAAVREKVTEGRFVPVGGMWVESDSTMPGSEAMARQFIAGKRFFLDEFGVECEEAWLPDSFGYSPSMPQIVRAAGLRWFLTQKISWNDTNRMPHHTFWWEGIDGSRVYTHFPPVDSYISELSGKELAHAERNFSEKGRASISLVPFGWGDGGGGPTREMIAAARRTADLEGSPKVRMDSPAAFFREAQAEYSDPPVWVGEMYLELHRGVFTSQLRTKQGNRRNEALLREAELWAATAALRTGLAYPRAELETAWRTVLLLQFHDILPGSAIAWVHRETERLHAEVTATVEAIVARSLDALAGAGAGAGEGAPADADAGLVANSAPFARDGVPALGVGRPAGDVRPVTVTPGPDGDILDNGIVRAVIDGRGHLVSLRAHADGREAIPAGTPAGVLRLYRDLPNKWDAWDIDLHHRRTVTELLDADERRVEQTPDAVSVVTVRRAGGSTFEQRVTLRAGAAAVELDVHVDWHERDRLLKLAVPLDVRADRVAAETQFGHHFRSALTNTSWEAARFEAVQHRFLHLAEPGYGVAIANESTYGYGVERTVRPDGGTTTTVGLSLLRGPRFPDPDSDQGEHTLRFAIAPGASVADAVELGYTFRNPPRPVRGAVASVPLVTSSDPAVVIETVKLAEDGSGDLVVRLYESRGGRATTTLTFDGTAASITCTDLLERTLPDTPAGAGSAIDLPFRPFQLRTVRFHGAAAR